MAFPAADEALTADLRRKSSTPAAIFNELKHSASSFYFGCLFRASAAYIAAQLGWRRVFSTLAFITGALLILPILYYSSRRCIFPVSGPGREDDYTHLPVSQDGGRPTILTMRHRHSGGQRPQQLGMGSSNRTAHAQSRSWVTSSIRKLASCFYKLWNSLQLGCRRIIVDSLDSIVAVLLIAFSLGFAITTVSFFTYKIGQEVNMAIDVAYAYSSSNASDPQAWQNISKLTKYEGPPIKRTSSWWINSKESGRQQIQQETWDQELLRAPLHPFFHAVSPLYRNTLPVTCRLVSHFLLSADNITEAAVFPHLEKGVGSENHRHVSTLFLLAHMVVVSLNELRHQLIAAVCGVLDGSVTVLDAITELGNLLMPILPYLGLSLISRGVFFSADILFQSVLFLSTLYILTTSQHGVLHAVSGIVAVVDRENSLRQAMEKSVRAIFQSTVKLAVFHVVFTWLSLRLAGVNEFVYICVALNGIARCLCLPDSLCKVSCP